MGFAIKKSLDIIDTYLSTLKEQFDLIKKINSSQQHLKIIDEQLIGSPPQALFLIQITGKNSLAKISAKELFEDKMFFLEFSKYDQERIINANKKNFALENARQVEIEHKEDSYKKPKLHIFEYPKYKISANTYKRDEKDFVYTIERTYKGDLKYENLCSDEILSKNSIFFGLSSTEAYSIGFNDGIKNAWMGINQISVIKKANKEKNNNAEIKFILRPHKASLFTV